MQYPSLFPSAPQLALLITTLMLGNYASRRRIVWIGEAGIALLLGAGFGLLLALLDKGDGGGGTSTYAEVRCSYGGV